MAYISTQKYKNHVRSTGCGAASVVFSGTKITFDDDGNYPKASIGYYISLLQRRNEFLEDVLFRATTEDSDDYEYYYDSEDYEYIESPMSST